MNLDDFSTVVDDRRYIKPQVALDEQNTFIENLRDTQGRGVNEVSTRIYNLGTDIPSNLGGLGGAGTYFESRYQTPQVAEMIATLRNTAQAQALNDALNNEVAMAKQRYNRAYKAAQRRNNNPSNNPSNNPANPNLPINTNKGDKNINISGEGSDIVDENTQAGFPYKSGIYKYVKNGAGLLYDSTAPYSGINANILTNGKDGTIKKVGGKTYITINGNLYPVIKTML